MKLNEWDPGDRFFGLFKGDPGSAKSIGASSWALKGPMYFFDFDGKINAIHNYWKNIAKRPEVLNNIEFDQFSDYNTAAKRMEEFIKGGHNFTGGIVWDTLTTSVDKILTQVNDLKGGGNKKVGGIAVNEIEDYNAESAALTRLIQDSKFKLKGNFFMLAHVVKTEEKELKTGFTKVTRQLVTAGKKVAAKIPAYFDEQWHFEVESEVVTIGGNPVRKNKYTVLTQHAGEDFARTSLPISQTIEFTYPKTLYEEFNKQINMVKM